MRLLAQGLIADAQLLNLRCLLLCCIAQLLQGTGEPCAGLSKRLKSLPLLTGVCSAAGISGIRAGPVCGRVLRRMLALFCHGVRCQGLCATPLALSQLALTIPCAPQQGLSLGLLCSPPQAELSQLAPVLLSLTLCAHDTLPQLQKAGLLRLELRLHAQQAAPQHVCVGIGGGLATGTAVALNAAVAPATLQVAHFFLASG
mmetsp:Transcript_47057/g.150252  ORF Transcript_47057/g.150252 Transcript_47057/m.150252 type:complete len:201 (+) Transcript_47057:1507-2109(+)